MKRLIWTSAFFGLLAPAFAQHVGVINPVRGMPAPAGAYQYGNILFPGGIVSQSHAARVGASISGYPPYTGVAPGAGPAPRTRTVVVPYAYPMAYPMAYPDPGYYAQPQTPSNVTVVVPQQPAPTVIINQNYGPEQQPQTIASESQESGGLRVWDSSSAGTPAQRQAEPPATRVQPAVADQKPTLYLIALKDSSLRTAIGYWVQDGTLHYVTPQSSVNHVTLDMVDRELTEQLNRERKLEMDLKGSTPAPR